MSSQCSVRRHPCLRERQGDEREERGTRAGDPHQSGREAGSVTGGFSLLSGNTYGRVIAIVAASLGAIGALLSVGGAYPWWSLGIFFLSVWVVYGVIVLGEDDCARVT